MHSAGVSLVRVLLLGALLTCLAYAAWMGTRLAGDPTVAFLRDRKGAAWILHDSPPELAPRPLGAVVCRFRTHISLPGRSAAAELVLVLAVGAQWVVRAPIRRAFAHGLFACWAVAVYAGFLATG